MRLVGVFRRTPRATPVPRTRPSSGFDHGDVRSGDSRARQCSISFCRRLRFHARPPRSNPRLLSGMGDVAGLVYTAAEHSAPSHAFFAVLPYARPVSLNEHRRMMDRLHTRAKAEDRPFDDGARNPARFVRLPGTVPGRPFEARTLSGAPLHVG